MNYKTVKYIPLAVSATALMPVVAKAQGTVGNAGLGQFDPGLGAGAGTLGSIVDSVITVLLWVATVAAVIYLIMSGFNYITAGGDQEKADGARKGIINAIIGIIVIMAAYFIIQTASGIGGDIADNSINSQLQL